MIIITHAITGAAIGALVNELISNPFEVQLIVLVSVFFALLPDINVLWKDLAGHHEDITHYPIFWVVLSLVLLSIESIFFTGYLFSLLLFVNTSLHMFLDLFGFRNGMHVLYPFSNKEYSITKIPTKDTLTVLEYIVLYTKNGNMIYELAIIVSGGITVYSLL